MIGLPLGVMLVGVMLVAGGPAPGMAPTGRWLTDDHGGVIEIGMCESGLCGRIIGESDPAALDWRGRIQCGLRIMDGFEESEAGVWDGRITDPRDGRVWRAQLRVDEAGRLKLRGYVGVPLLGSTRTWTHYTGTMGAGCAIGPQG